MRGQRTLSRRDRRHPRRQLADAMPGHIAEPDSPTNTHPIEYAASAPFGARVWNVLYRSGGADGRDVTKPPSSMEGGFVGGVAECLGQIACPVGLGSSRAVPERSKAPPCSAGCERTGQSGRGQAAGGPERGSEARWPSRACEATAEPAATVAAPRSVRLTPSGVRSNPPGGLAADHAVVGGEGR